MRTFIVLCLLASQAQAQTLRFPPDAILLQELYHGCELGRTQAFFNSKLYPQLKQGLALAYATRNKGLALEAHKQKLERFPTAVLIRIRVGSCGDPA